MKAVLINEFGGSENLIIGELEIPQCGASEILVNVRATALNRADILQRKGLYPPPPGASTVLGLEIAGIVVKTGGEVSKWKVGDAVFGLLAGGGYAEFAVIHEDLAMSIPEGMNFTEAAAIPEVFLTAYQAIVYLAKLKKEESILIHAGASGVGTAAIQLAKVLKAGSIFITASANKHELCAHLGASVTIDYKSKNFEKEILALTDEKGVDVIIDFLGASYFQKNLNILDFDGRMIMLALMGGATMENLNLSNILRKRLRIIGSTLRARSLDYKIGLTRDFSMFALSKFSTKELVPVVDSIFDWKDVSEAHTFMEANKNKGKIVLHVS